MDALKQTDTSSMTKEQKKALQELIQSLALSQKEMQQADTKQALASAGQKLSYKYGQAAQISGADALASVLKNIHEYQYRKPAGTSGDVQSTTQNTTQSGTSVGNPRSLRKPVPRIPGMGKIRAVERTEVEVAMEVEAETAEKEGDEGNTLEITGDTTLHRALQTYPYLKEFLLQLSPKYKPLSNPALFAMMSRVADFRTIAAKGGFTEEELLGKIKEEITKRNNG